ncbi:hypothetical protein [Synechococcus sp. LTW-R]|uniref:hypothetical protein n=1 Tax=Synechococcus sp. LTW-R TaxID=2751170 RepID=UPI0016283FBF|nr:hypothetical protein [Synechococcus sp. LTW-R]QNG28510.1 hypothetical protein H0O22_05185 [Synechococcus sp. LTW-R]|tara:strand:- start:170 stop:370 length:201 start_codon:yes stop_codon:yes gene_type:complete
MFKGLQRTSMNRAELDAIELMLRDLNTRHEEIRHRAAFRGCTRELVVLQQELVQYLTDKKAQISGR